MENSQSSTTSTVPYEITLNCDPDFVEELESVNNLYFGNVEVTEDADGLNDDSDNDSDFDDSLNNYMHVHETENETHDTLDSDIDTDQEFLKNGCGCNRLYGRPCSAVVNRDLLISYRYTMLEKSKSELDLIIKAQLFHHRTVNDKSKRGSDRQRPRQDYYFAGQSVCRNLFAFAHGLHRKTIDAIARSIDMIGMDERVHGNKGNMPSNALNVDDVKCVKNFLVTYATQNGVPLPGRMATCRNEKNILLPSDKNKTDIYYLYSEACDSANMKKVALRTFYRLWQEHCPYLLVMKPATDLCATCRKFSYSLMNSGNCTEEEKQLQLDLYNDHLKKVQCQRDHYREQCEQSKHSYESLSPEDKVRGRAPCSVDSAVVYSFDYAQQVLYPHYAQQVGPMFFRTPRKCQCFGICCESSGNQIFYLIDEGEGAGKGANSVTSMLHHHFTTHGYGEKHVKLNMDNCGGQNKNNTVIGYGLWRTITRAHQTVEFSLMEAGHTKFSPDWHFGLWKSRWRNSTAETLEDVARSITESSRGGHNRPQVVADATNPVVFYDWKTYLSQFFKALPNMKKKHYFRMTSSHPGMVFTKEYMFSPEESFQVLKPGINITGFPERITEPGLDPVRQWYLYEEIGPLCLNSSQACPKPSIPKPNKSGKKETTVTKSMAK